MVILATTEACLQAADAIFQIFAQQQLNTVDGFFALSVAVARTVQKQCSDSLQRELMIDTFAKIVMAEALGLDKAKLAAGATIIEAR